MSGTEIAFYWLLFASFTGFALMVWDKHQAKTGGWRVAESTLIFWAVVGGANGVFAAQQILRHKTTKQPISSILTTLFVIEIPLCLTLYFYASQLLPRP